MRMRIWCLMAMLLALPLLALAGNEESALLGTWLTGDGSAEIEIVFDHGAYNGHVVWLKEPLFPANDPEGMTGKPKTDRLNPDAALRTRPIMGLTVLTGLHYAGNGVWQGGSLYAPASGKSYACKITFTSDNNLKVSVGGSVFGRTSVWTRVKSGTVAVPAAFY